MKCGGEAGDVVITVIVVGHFMFSGYEAAVRAVGLTGPRHRDFGRRAFEQQEESGGLFDHEAERCRD